MGRTSKAVRITDDDGDIIEVAEGGLETKPFDALIEGGLLSLVADDEEVNTNDYGASVEGALGATHSGEILQFVFYATETGSGAIQDSAGKLIILDADPEINDGDTAMTAAERITVLGQVEVSPSDWQIDANGGSAIILNQPVAFHALASLFFVWFHTDAVDLNDGAGDDEVLQMNFWYRRDS